ncbi:MAG: class II fructose-bisphosphate aldolase [Solobacterium sp.]|nr:class II fructose-bisphosphate aldolase [Solobacterium sp.]
MLVTMNDVLIPAKEGGYGVGFFNAVTLEQARAVIETAEELHSPVMIGTADGLNGFVPLKEAAYFLRPLAQAASVPVALHYDHGYSFESCMDAVKNGFTSIMFDCSTLPYEENIRSLAEMVKICHAMGITVEGELGHVGDNEGSGKLEKPSDYYTDPQVALNFVQRTGVDALAIAVGNAHGDYKFPPKLDFERIQTISGLTGIPLVLHGGSGLSDDDFRTAVSLGISKINIFTDIDKAGRNGLKQAIDEGAVVMRDMLAYERNAMKAVVAEKLTLFGSVGKA